MKKHLERLIIYVVMSLLYLILWKLFTFEVAIIIALGQIMGQLYFISVRIK